jgi:hypothetical protein
VLKRYRISRSAQFFWTTAVGIGHKKLYFDLSKSLFIPNPTIQRMVPLSTEETVSITSVAEDFEEEDGIGDFDYIGTGGFVIVCGDESECIGVSKEQADLVFQNCPFFQVCLNHGSEKNDDEDESYMMREAKTRIIHKPDWSVAIARHFIEIMTKGKTTLPDLGLADGILAAGDQSLVDLRLSSLVNYLDTCSKDNDFMRLVDLSFFQFHFQAVVTSDQWLALLDRGVLLFREQTNYVVQLHKNETSNGRQSYSRRQLDSFRSEFLVHSEWSIQAIYEIQRCLSENSDRNEKSNGTEEAFIIYLETAESISKDHNRLISTLAGGEGFMLTCPDSADHKTVGYTVTSSLDVLSRAIEPIDKEKVIHCSFRVDNPTPDTLGRLINACQRAKDYPGTLGLDPLRNRYFCRKSMKDILIVLDYMRDYSTSSKVVADFRLFSMSSESHLF